MCVTPCARARALLRNTHYINTLPYSFATNLLRLSTCPGLGYPAQHSFHNWALQFLDLFVILRFPAGRAPPEPQVVLRRGVGDPKVFEEEEGHPGHHSNHLGACPRNVPDRVRTSVSKRTRTTTFRKLMSGSSVQSRQVSATG